MITPISLLQEWCCLSRTNLLYYLLNCQKKKNDVRWSPRSGRVWKP